MHNKDQLLQIFRLNDHCLTRDEYLNALKMEITNLAQSVQKSVQKRIEANKAH